MSQWISGPNGGITVRRKLKPTGVERTVYGEGDVRCSLFLSFVHAFRVEPDLSRRAPIFESTRRRLAVWECYNAGSVVFSSIFPPMLPGSPLSSRRSTHNRSSSTPSLVNMRKFTPLHGQFFPPNSLTTPFPSPGTAPSSPPMPSRRPPSSSPPRPSSPHRTSRRSSATKSRD
jgi:hypothetical protein